jgi:hypothetical protein
MWPLAVGNKWVFERGDLVDDIHSIEIVSQEAYSGYTAWGILWSETTASGQTSEYDYWVFVNGWLYVTRKEAALESLPQIGGGLFRLFPQVFRDGETFTVDIAALPGAAQSGGGELQLTVLFRGADVLDLLYETIPTIFHLTRHQGQGCPDPPYLPCALLERTIVGSCSGFYRISPTSQWVMVGNRVLLSVPAAPGQSFQWYKDGELLEDSTTSTYLKVPAELEDSGDYTCRVSDGSNGYGTAPAHVTVLPKGAVPVVGAAGLVVLGGLIAAIGKRALERR